MRIASISADGTPLARGDGTGSEDRSRRLAALASALAAAGHAVDVFTRRRRSSRSRRTRTWCSFRPARPISCRRRSCRR
jgi:hypothetical protein